MECAAGQSAAPGLARKGWGLSKQTLKIISQLVTSVQIPAFMRPKNIYLGFLYARTVLDLETWQGRKQEKNSLPSWSSTLEW